MRKTQYLVWLIMVGVLLIGSAVETRLPSHALAQTNIVQNDNTQSPNQIALGIVKQKPAQGPFVKIEHGYMMPYTAKIPGTEIEFTMVPIPGGTFTMGSPEDEEDRRDDEGPQFNVTVKPFWMGKHEVTWAQYRCYMELDDLFKELQREGRRIVTEENEVDAVTAPSPLWKPTVTFDAGDGLNEPAASMTQFAAKQYTKWLGRISGQFYRLPTEAEWEYACRAGTKTAYYFGDDPAELDKHAWYYETSDDVRNEVGQLLPNPWGLHDMYGNVAEWVLDEYDESGFTHVKPGATVTVDQAYRRPTKLFPRVLKGGSWEMEPEDCRSAARMASDAKAWKVDDPNIPKSPTWFATQPAFGVGFRIMRPLHAPATKEEQNKYLDADLESIIVNVKRRAKNQGKGSYGTADPRLPGDIKNIRQANK